MNDLSKIEFFGRKQSFQRCLSELTKNMKGSPANIVETGCVRSGKIEDLIGDGASTLVFAQYLSIYGGELTTVDIEEKNINICRELTHQFKFINYNIGDSVSFLKNYDKKIDLLYMDSFDTANDINDPIQAEVIKGANFHQLEEIKSAFDKLHNGSIVMSDDYPRKGKCTAEFLVKNGWMVFYCDSEQIALTRNDKYNFS